MTTFGRREVEKEKCEKEARLASDIHVTAVSGFNLSFECKCTHDSGFPSSDASLFTLASETKGQDHPVNCFLKEADKRD